MAREEPGVVDAAGGSKEKLFGEEVEDLCEEEDFNRGGVG
jgi:hypothetical protein